MGEIKVINGNMAAAIGAAMCRPDIIAAYPITPQTPIVEYLADLLIAAELEHRVKIVEMLNKDGLIAGLEERLDRLKKEDGAYEKQNAA